MQRNSSRRTSWVRSLRSPPGHLRSGRHAVESRLRRGLRSAPRPCQSMYSEARGLQRQRLRLVLFSSCLLEGLGLLGFGVCVFESRTCISSHFDGCQGDCLAQDGLFEASGWLLGVCRSKSQVSGWIVVAASSRRARMSCARIASAKREKPRGTRESRGAKGQARSRRTTSRAWPGALRWACPWPCRRGRS